MKKTKKILSAVMAVAMLSSISAIPVSAEEETRFLNEDGSFNIDAIQSVIDENNASVYSALEKSPIKYEFNNSVFNTKKIGSTFAQMISNNLEEEIEKNQWVDGGNINMIRFKKLVADRFETECIDGKNYITLDGEKFEYYFAPDTEQGWQGDLYYNMPATYKPLMYNPYDTTKYKYNVRQEDGKIVEVNSDKLTYVQMLDLCYEFYWLQKDRIIFTNAFELFNLESKGYFGDAKVEDLSDEDLIKALVNYSLKAKYQNELKKVVYDIDGNSIVDVKDLSMIIRYINHTVEFTPAQEMISGIDDAFKPDIRTVTAVKQHILKLID